jgi:hypothetical protein
MALCGYTDWRMPTVEELQSIVDYGKPHPGPAINTSWFPNTPSNVYWTATIWKGVNFYGWLVAFDSGGVGIRDSRYYDFYHVRLVRSSQ